MRQAPDFRVLDGRGDRGGGVGLVGEQIGGCVFEDGGQVGWAGRGGLGEKAGEMGIYFVVGEDCRLGFEDLWVGRREVSLT